MALSAIQLKNINHPLRIVFQPPVSLDTHKGSFNILPEQQMGSIDGSYEVTKEGENISIKVTPEEGWKSVPNSTVTKLILGEKSLFCNWSKKYVFEQKINRIDLSSEAKWTNYNIRSNSK
jgi:hypothetical protein